MSKQVHLFVVLLLCSQAMLARQVITQKGKEPTFLVAPSLAGPGARQYVFSRFSSFNGLSTNAVSNIVQDHKGYMWLSTPNGLQRYDGNKFVTFRHQHNNPNTLPEDNVGWVYIDRHDVLWVLTADNRIGTFDTDNFTYHEVKLNWKGEKPTIFIPKGIVETNDGQFSLYIGFDNVYLYHPDSSNFSVAEDLAYQPAGWRRHSVYYDSLTGRTWLGCDSGLVMYDPATRHINYTGHNPDHNKIIDVLGRKVNILNPHVDRRGRMLLANWDFSLGGPRLYYYDPATGELRTHIVSEELFKGGYHEIAGIMEQRNGRLWIFGLPFIAEYADGEHHLQGVRNEYKDEQSIKFDVAYSMYEDRAQNLWVCTSNGVYLFNPDAQVFNAFHLLHPDGRGAIDGPTKTVLEADSNHIWVGGWGIGMYAYDKNFNPAALPPSMKPYEQDYVIWCMQRHPATHNIWIGMQDGGMLIYDPSIEKTKYHHFDIFNNRTIRQMIVDSKGDLWFGTQGGLVVKWSWKPGRPIEEGFTEVAHTGRILKLFMDNKGYIWVGTFGAGLLKIDPTSHKILEQYRAQAPKGKRLWNDLPGDIIQTNDSTLVVANYGVTIVNMNTGTTSFISTDDGLPSTNVMCLQQDKQGIIWLGMTGGICRMNMQKKTFAFYDRRDGLPADYFEVDDAHKLSDGRMLFTSAHNFVVFDPEKMIKTGKPPEVMITDVKLDNVSLPLDSVNRLSSVHLQHDKSSISIEFGGFNYIRQYKIDYYYRLEGVDKDWIKAGDRREALYNHLEPGSYVFRVKSSNPDGMTSETVTSLKIRVMPPFWQTGWFYGLLVLLGIGILYWIDHERMKRIRGLQAMRTQIAGNLHEEINTTLNNINMLSEMARIKADKDLNRSKEYIDQISEKSHNMIIAMDDMLWSIDPQNDSMEKTLLRMLEFVDALTNRHGANIDMLVDEHVRSLELDMKSRHEMLLIFKEVLRSLVSVSTGSHILVNIDQVKSKLFLKMQDDGSYKSEADIFSSAVLNMLGRRTQALKAEIDIHADKNGASVILQVPLTSPSIS